MRELAGEIQARRVPRFHMTGYVLRAFADLVFYDLLVALLGFPTIRRVVKRTVVKETHEATGETIATICDAVDVASCFYFKQVRCMHRSFVAVRMLRKSGVSAELIIGSRPIPFVSHAWVEVAGRIVNDKQGYKRRLMVMERM
jgi:Transglutaminase-like superfamily